VSGPWLLPEWITGKEEEIFDSQGDCQGVKTGIKKMQNFAKIFKFFQKKR
jgi:hypothetical protein